MAPSNKQSPEHKAFSTFMHKHPLTPANFKSPAQGAGYGGGSSSSSRICDICRDDLEGLVFQCELCGFDVHEACTLFPQELGHPLDPTHPLVLKPSLPTPCAICGSPCQFWRYCNADLSLHLHLECAIISMSSQTEKPPAASHRAPSTADNKPPHLSPYAGHVNGIPLPFNSPNCHRPSYGLYRAPAPAPYPAYYYPPPPPLYYPYPYPNKVEAQGGGTTSSAWGVRRLLSILGAFGAVTEAISGVSNLPSFF